MREIITETDIKAPVAAVWRILTDLHLFPEWNPFIREAKGEVATGAALKVQIQPPGGKAMTFKPTVTHVSAEREFRWLGRFLMPGLFDGEHIFELEPLDQARTRFVHREQFSGLLVPLLWKSLDTNTRQGFDDMNAALKARAEE